MTAEIHTLAGAYALRALDDDEERLFLRHLAVCKSCQDEVEDYRHTAALLGSVVVEPPPAALRTRVLELADVTPQHRVPTAAARGWQRRTQAALAPIAAGLVLALLLTSGALMQQRREIAALRTAQDQTAETLAQLAAADDRVRIAMEGDGHATLVWSPSLQRAVLVADGLPRLQDDRVFQLWFFRDGVPSPSEVFTSHDGRGIAVASAPDGFDGAAVTVEPPGGVPTPTGPIILASA